VQRPLQVLDRLPHLPKGEGQRAAGQEGELQLPLALGIPRVARDQSLDLGGRDAGVLQGLGALPHRRLDPAQEELVAGSDPAYPGVVGVRPDPILPQRQGALEVLPGLQLVTHGGEDPGALSEGQREFHLRVGVAGEIAAELLVQLHRPQGALHGLISPARAHQELGAELQVATQHVQPRELRRVVLVQLLRGASPALEPRRLGLQVAPGLRHERQAPDGLAPVLLQPPFGRIRRQRLVEQAHGLLVLDLRALQIAQARHLGIAQDVPQLGVGHGQLGLQLRLLLGDLRQPLQELDGATHQELASPGRAGQELDAVVQLEQEAGGLLPHLLEALSGDVALLLELDPAPLELVPVQLLLPGDETQRDRREGQDQRRAHAGGGVPLGPAQEAQPGTRAAGLDGATPHEILQVPGQAGDAGVAVLAPALDGRQADRLHVPGHAAIQPPNAGRGALEDSRAHQLGGLGGEGAPQGQELVEGHPQGIHVGARVQLPLAAHLLGRHVGQRARLGAAASQVIGALRAGQAEVQEHRPTRAVDGDVGGLHVPVQHPAGVGVGQGQGHLPD